MNNDSVGNVLEVDNLTVSYGGLVALDGVSISVAPGECVALLGPNGAGKTSLVNAVAGIVKHGSGDIRFNGSSVARIRSSKRVAKGISLVPEGRRLFVSLTVAENLMLARASRRNREFGSSLAEVYDVFPALASRRDQDAGTLSGGEQQMLAIARALLTKPELLILDEPSIGLAPKMVAELYKQLSQVLQQGISVLVVEQNISALEIGDRVVVLRGGSVVAEGSPQDFEDGEGLAEAYLGSV